MFPHRTAEPQVMVLLEKRVEEALPFRAANQPDLHRSHPRQGPLDRRGVAELPLRHAPVADRVIDRLDARRGKLDMARPVQDQHQAAADHVAQLAVGLNPVPSLADFGREGASTGLRVRSDQIAQPIDLGLPDRPATVTQEDIGHAPRE